MKGKLILAFALALPWSLPALCGDAKTGDDLQGTWLPLSAELGGKLFPDDLRKNMKLVVKGDTYTVVVGKKVDRGLIKRNPTTNPKEMDIIGTEGPNKGQTILAIYERTNDTLRVCYDLGGKNRPKEFNTRNGALLFLVTYKRESP